MQLFTPKWVQFLHSIIIPPDAFGVILKHTQSMLHLGFFTVLAGGVKKASIAHFSILASSSRSACIGSWHARILGSETTSNATISSFSMPLGGEGSVVGDWNGGNTGEVCIGSNCRYCRQGWALWWMGLYLFDGVAAKNMSKDLLLMILYYGEKWYMLSFIETLSVWMKERIIQMLSIWMKETILVPRHGFSPLSNAQCFQCLPAS